MVCRDLSLQTVDTPKGISGTHTNLPGSLGRSHLPLGLSQERRQESPRHLQGMARKPECSRWHWECGSLQATARGDRSLILLLTSRKMG